VFSFLTVFVDGSYAAFSNQFDDFEVGEGCGDFFEGWGGSFE